MLDPSQQKYPLLWEIMSIRGLSLKATYTNRNVAEIFEVSARSIQDWITSGRLISRDLPGRARFLSADLEEFLRNSRKDKQ